MVISLAAGFIVVPSFIGSSDAEAQYRYRRARPGAAVVIVPRGLYVGGGLLGTAILDQRGGPEYLDNGGGLSLYGGIRLGRMLALELGWLGSLHNPQTVDGPFGPETDFLVLGGITADAKIYFNSGQPNVRGEPYIQGGLGVYFLDSGTFGTQSVGTGFQLGGGYDFLVGQNLRLGVRGLYRGIAMGPPESGVDDTFVSGVTFEGNLTIEFY
jgi:hypothetical protein